MLVSVMATVLKEICERADEPEAALEQLIELLRVKDDAG